MGMSTNLHANVEDNFRVNGYINEDDKKQYAVITIGVNSGYSIQDVTLFLNHEQVTELKRALTKLDTQFKRYISKKELLEEVNE